mgnify:CR=1 FL=1
MKTEEHIIIILTVVEENATVNITYTSSSDEGNVRIVVTDSEGNTTHSFDRVAKAENGKLSFQSGGLRPGAYTCSIEQDGKIKDSKQFQIGR